MDPENLYDSLERLLWLESEMTDEDIQPGNKKLNEYNCILSSIPMI